MINFYNLITNTLLARCCCVVVAINPLNQSIVHNSTVKVPWYSTISIVLDYFLEGVGSCTACTVPNQIESNQIKSNHHHPIHHPIGSKMTLGHKKRLLQE